MTIDEPDNLQTFALRNKIEVERFCELVEAYFKSLTGYTSGHISLTKAFERLQGYEDGGRIFTALLDFHINLHLLHVEMIRFGGEWNQYYRTDIFKGGGSVLDSKERFFSKMRAHQYASCFILRYRAIWDKLMGILILVYLPEKYEEFGRAKSRRRKFTKLAEISPHLGKDFADNLNRLLENFEQKFRTPEAHETGALRKWSFLIQDPIHNPQSEFIECWNALNNVVIHLVERLDIKFEKQQVTTKE